MSEIKGKLWGFKKREVDEHIKQIQNSHEAQLVDLTKEVEGCQREKDLLGQELSTLADQNASSSSMALLELAISKLESVTKYIDKATEEEVLAIQKSARLKLLALEKTIELLEKEIKQAKEAIDLELKKLVKIANSSDQMKSTTIGTRDYFDNKTSGKVYPISDWLKSNKSEPSSKENEFWEEQLENPQELEDQLENQQELEQKMTADGATQVPFIKPDSLMISPADNRAKQLERNPEAFDKKNDDECKEDEFAVGMEEDHPESKEDMESSFDFWDSGSDLEEEPEPREQAPSEPEHSPLEVVGSLDRKTEEQLPEFIEDIAVVRVDKPEDFFQSEEDSSFDFFQLEENSSEEVLSKPADSEGLGGEANRSEHSQSQAGVRQEIDAVRHKYVLGKLAGEDLIDDSGRVIIRKNDKITEKVLELAQKEGKLADLIIHMVLPGQEE